MIKFLNKRKNHHDNIKKGFYKIQSFEIPKCAFTLIMGKQLGRGLKMALKGI